MRDELNDEADVLEALRALVQQIAMSDFRDHLGHRLTMNVAYRDALAVVKLKVPNSTTGG